jgi:protein required for attachment to host cells
MGKAPQQGFKSWSTINNHPINLIESNRIMDNLLAKQQANNNNNNAPGLLLQQQNNQMNNLQQQQQQQQASSANNSSISPPSTALNSNFPSRLYQHVLDLTSIDKREAALLELSKKREECKD